MATKSRAQRQNQKALPRTGAPFPLAEEVKTYEDLLPAWADREGQFVLIKGRDVLGFYTQQEEALEAGYGRLGDEPFLVKQVRAQEPIYQLGQIEL